MRKTKKQKRHEDKHWRTYELYSKPYMQKASKGHNMKRPNRFDIGWFGGLVRSIIRINKVGRFPHSDNCAVSIKGAFITFPDKKVSIGRLHTTKN